ncbi:GGDEF domain-containing protein [Anabaena subtropica]|uniref:GGDEF domain-containing protein n=1 Tax=Anabaena subtropica FACHB-260 TaxID=2692884 RepID=A0ABR8CV59_9NOST|nr:GGDEF domain-containing protein [Anabaena subtropica]MBD2346864.1 GGDEF domain-containing protein [Anabaena subtropica FACHB-260]
MRFIQTLEAKNQSFSALLSIFLMMIIGLIDYCISPEISVSILYLFPIGISVWFVNKHTGFLICVASDITSLVVNQIQDKYHFHPLIHFWNALVMLVFFLFVNHLLAQLKATLNNLEKLARTDNLTGLTNRGFFLDIVNNEIEKSLRHKEPLTLAYVDVDNFKQINDQFGHNFGDRLLELIAKTTQKTLRKIDVIARIGGDEFAILLPRTGYEAAEVVLNRVQKSLLSSMKQEDLSVTFSIGAITFVRPPHSVSEIIEIADNLMYSAKKKGKNLLQHELLENAGVGTEEWLVESCD